MTKQPPTEEQLGARMAAVIEAREQNMNETLDQILSTVPSGTLMAAFHCVRTRRGGAADSGPSAPAWAGAVVDALVDHVRDERGAADPLLAAHRWLGAQLQRIAQAALSESRMYRDGDYQVWEGVLPSGFRSLCELQAFARGASYALITAPGAPEPTAEGDRPFKLQLVTAWGKL
jgi:hypothetical protein